MSSPTGRTDVEPASDGTGSDDPEPSAADASVVVARDDGPVVETTALDAAAAANAPAAAPEARRRLLQYRVIRAVGILAISIGALWFWNGFQIEGHGWGDDFALYVNQARSLVQGDVGQTIADNHYAVDNSAWHTFSPYAYPWGVPLLLAPVMALTGSVDPVHGIDYAPLKFVITLTFLIGLFAYHHVCRRRVHVVASVLLPLFFATGYWYVNHTDQILSELPFLMWVMLFVVWLDRVRERGLLLGGSRWHLVVLGALACTAFNTRREGLGLLLGLLAAQVVAAIIETGPGSLRERAGRLTSVDWRGAATPWITFTLSAVVVQLVLPADFLPKYTERDPAADTGLHRIPDNIGIYKPLLAEQLGLKDAGPNEITAFQSARLGEIVLYAIVTAAVLGIVLALATQGRRDAGLVGSALGVTGAVLVAPFQDYRYLMPLLPFVLLFAMMGVSIPLRTLTGLADKWPMLVGEIALVALILGGMPDTRNAHGYRSAWIGTQAGPQQPETLEMWQAVRTETRGDSVIVFSRARTMALYTGRKTVQGGAIEFTARAGDYYVMYLEADGSPGTYSQYPLTDEEAAERGFTEVWRNAGWVIWRIPPLGGALP
jgi:hypothetical protein